MGVKSTVGIIINGKVTAIGSEYGLNRSLSILKNNTVSSGTISKIDNSATGNMHLVTYTGVSSGATFSILVDEFAKFYNDSFTEIGVVTDLTVGDTIYGTYEFFTVDSVAADVADNTTYGVSFSGTTGYFCIPESGLIIG